LHPFQTFFSVFRTSRLSRFFINTVLVFVFAVQPFFSLIHLFPDLVPLMLILKVEKYFAPKRRTPIIHIQNLHRPVFPNFFVVESRKSSTGYRYDNFFVKLSMLHSPLGALEIAGRFPPRHLGTPSGRSTRWAKGDFSGSILSWPASPNPPPWLLD